MNYSKLLISFIFVHHRLHRPYSINTSKQSYSGSDFHVLRMTLCVMLRTRTNSSTCQHKSSYPPYRTYNPHCIFFTLGASRNCWALLAVSSRGMDNSVLKSLVSRLYSCAFVSWDMSSRPHNNTL